MKKSVIITVGIVFILIVLGIWGYLLFFGTPSDSEEVFANLGLGSTSQPPAENGGQLPGGPDTEEPVTQVDTQTDALRQLTTRPVAGFGFVGTSSELLRYVERGTGHVFELDLARGEERRVSGTTIPRVVEAVFSDGGESVALISEDGRRRDIVAGVIDVENTAVDFISLPAAAFAPHFMSRTQLRYAVRGESGTDGYELDVRENDPVRIFSIPLRDVAVIWGDDDTFVYNKPTGSYPGSLYRIGTQLTPVTERAFGFVGGVTDSFFMGSKAVDGTLHSFAADRVTGEMSSFAVPFVPEKCVSNDHAVGTTLWCGAPLDVPTSGFIESWYAGEEQSQDMLWYIDIQQESARLVANFLEISGRLIDIDGIAVDASGERPIFRNKVDNTLWIYDSRAE